MNLWAEFFIISQLFTLPADAAGLTDFHQDLTKYCKQKTECKSCNMENSNSQISTDSTAIKKASDAAMAVQCQTYYNDNHCDEVQKSLIESQRSEIISCSAEKICSHQDGFQMTECAVGAFKAQFTAGNIISIGLSTVAGVVTGSTIIGGTIVGLPLLIYGASKSEEECSTDLVYKKQSIRLHNLALLPSEKSLQDDDENILHMPCFELRKFLNSRLDVFVHRRSENQRWSLENLKNQTSADQILLNLLKSNKCFNQKSLTAMYCKEVASFLMSGVLSGGMTAGFKKFTPSPKVKPAQPLTPLEQQPRQPPRNPELRPPIATTTINGVKVELVERNLDAATKETLSHFEKFMANFGYALKSKNSYVRPQTAAELNNLVQAYNATVPEKFKIVTRWYDGVPNGEDYLKNWAQGKLALDTGHDWMVHVPGHLSIPKEIIEKSIRNHAQIWTMLESEPFKRVPEFRQAVIEKIGENVDNFYRPTATMSAANSIFDWKICISNPENFRKAISTAISENGRAQYTQELRALVKQIESKLEDLTESEANENFKTMSQKIRE